MSGFSEYSFDERDPRKKPVDLKKINENAKNLTAPDSEFELYINVNEMDTGRNSFENLELKDQ